MSETGAERPVGQPRLRASEALSRDLATNQPGQAARARALELRQVAPVKTLVARALRVHTDERAWRVGADGEEEVARRLRRLGSEWRVIHAVPVGDRGSDIDHLVIGPAGVFTLNTKNHSASKVWVGGNTFLVNGQRTDYLRNSRYEAQRASALLSAACGFLVPVDPIIVVMAANLTVKSQPAGVHIVGRRWIAKWLSSRPEVLTRQGVEHLYGVARWESTWH